MKLLLLVENERDDQLLFLDTLNRSGLCNPVMVVSDGGEAIRYLNGQGIYQERMHYPVPGVLMLDLFLPRFSGWDVLRWTRADARFNSLLIVVLTASLRVADLKTAYALGANCVLPKPCHAQDLLRLSRTFPSQWCAASELLKPQSDPRSPLGYTPENFETTGNAPLLLASNAPEEAT